MLQDQNHAGAATGASTPRTKRTLFRFKSDESLEEWACETSSTAPAGMVDNMAALGLAKDRVDLEVSVFSLLNHPLPLFDLVCENASGNHARNPPGN